MKASLVLASGSAARRDMLRNAGYDFEIHPADIDEASYIKDIHKKSESSLVLAKEKALHVSLKIKDKYIIGSDQILIMNDNLYSKAKNKKEAFERLKFFRARSHQLISSVAVYKNGEMLFHDTDEAHLTMRDFSDDELQQYCDKAGDVLTSCVGCYALESLGIRLFKEIKGDYFTILGMPLLSLINFLNKEGFSL